MSATTSFFITIYFTKKFIEFMERRGLYEKIRFDYTPHLQDIHKHKEKTPTMGGVVVSSSIIISSVLWAKWDNLFVWTSLCVLFMFTLLGLVDDLIKIKTSKNGLSKQTKLYTQIIIGVLSGLFLYFYNSFPLNLEIPFLKSPLYLGGFFIFWTVLVIVASSNAVNITDGLDGLAVGSLVFVGVGLGILCYITGHKIFSSYLFLPYIKECAELVPILGAFVGALLGFLWFNCFPAQIFLGDAGALSLGGFLGYVSVLSKKELLLVILGGVFVVETLSVILQVISFKLRKKRIFKVAPLHHHFQVKGLPEAKIIIRFWIISAILMLVALSTLKIR